MPDLKDVQSILDITKQLIDDAGSTAYDAQDQLQTLQEMFKDTGTITSSLEKLLDTSCSQVEGITDPVEAYELGIRQAIDELT